MKNKIAKEIAIATSAVLLGWGSLLAQQIARPQSPQQVAPFDGVDELDASVAPDIIFSNLSPKDKGVYNSDPYEAFPLDGKDASGETENWDAIRFTATENFQAKILAAAIGYTSGVRLINLGIYADDNGSVGTLLPGAQGSTTQIPDLGQCCQLARVTLTGEGVTLTAGTNYWLVASPDNVNGRSFRGAWSVSNRAIYAGLVPPFLGAIIPGRGPPHKFEAPKSLLSVWRVSTFVAPGTRITRPVGKCRF